MIWSRYTTVTVTHMILSDNWLIISHEICYKQLDLDSRIPYLINKLPVLQLVGYLCRIILKLEKWYLNFVTRFCEEEFNNFCLERQSLVENHCKHKFFKFFWDFILYSILLFPNLVYELDRNLQNIPDVKIWFQPKRYTEIQVSLGMAQKSQFWVSKFSR